MDSLYTDTVTTVILLSKKNELDEFSHFLEYSEGKEFKPYLRPMSSMTKEELKEYENARDDWYDDLKTYDWLLAHHFDYRGLIEKGLALEAPERMYKN